jgi:hypothetical protein
MAPPLLHKHQLSNAERINQAIVERYRQLTVQQALRHSHHFHGRFENTYVPLDQIPQLQPVVDVLLTTASRILDYPHPLHFGFWFNEMGPGHITSLHNHDEADELLSACYYLSVPRHSGRFVAVQQQHRTYLQPEEGMLVLFSPSLEHEVEENRSDATRLSVAFNIGPADRD